MSQIASEGSPRSFDTGRALRTAIDAGARVAALVVLFCLFGLLVGRSFFTANNVENILMQSAVYTMAGLGMTMVIITGGIDLAAGSVIALAMVVTALILKTGGADAYTLKWSLLALLGGVASAAVIGLLQGVLITGLRLVPFIVTLGGLQAVRGLAKGVADNGEVIPPPNWLSDKLMLPVQRLDGGDTTWDVWRNINPQLFAWGVWGTIAAAVIAAAILRYTKLGRRIFAIGSNEATARLCGVPVARTKIIVYVLSGVFAGLAGVLEFSKLNIGQPTGAQAYELYVIAACVIGGTSLRGGMGGIFGTVIGALIIGTLNAGAQQANWEKWVQEVVIGLIIIAAVALDQLRMRRRT